MANNVNGNVGARFTIFASAARTATPNTEEFELPAGVRQGYFVIDVTAATSTPSTTFLIEGVDRVSGKTWTLLQSAAIVGTGTTVLRINDSLTAAANTIAKDALPPVIRVTATHGNANSQTYTVAGQVGR
jgi:hypothetical protein